MSKWFGKITSDPDDLTHVLDAYDYYEKELDSARNEVRLEGNVEKHSASLPGVVEYRYSQLQEVEAILEHLNIKMTRVKGKKYRDFLEHYNKALSSRDAERFAEADEDVLTLAQIINQFALIRNKYLAIHKGFDTKSFQIHNIVKLRTAGMEDAEVQAIYVPR